MQKCLNKLRPSWLLDLFLKELIRKKFTQAHDCLKVFEQTSKHENITNFLISIFLVITINPLWENAQNTCLTWLMWPGVLNIHKCQCSTRTFKDSLIVIYADLEIATQQLGHRILESSYKTFKLGDVSFLNMLPCALVFFFWQLIANSW